MFFGLTFATNKQMNKQTVYNISLQDRCFQDQVRADDLQPKHSCHGVLLAAAEVERADGDLRPTAAATQVERMNLYTMQRRVYDARNGGPPTGAQKDVCDHFLLGELSLYIYIYIYIYLFIYLFILCYIYTYICFPS